MAALTVATGAVCGTYMIRHGKYKYIQKRGTFHYSSPPGVKTSYY
jgi:hypothetical protein